MYSEPQGTCYQKPTHIGEWKPIQRIIPAKKAIEVWKHIGALNLKALIDNGILFLETNEDDAPLEVNGFVNDSGDYCYG